jgi:hypothetical protein
MGLLMTIVSARIVLSHDFTRKMREGLWKPTDAFSRSKEGYFTDRYIRGGATLIAWLIFISYFGYLILVDLGVL